MKMLPQLLASAALLWTAVAQAPEPFPVLNGHSSEGNPPQPDTRGRLQPINRSYKFIGCHWQFPTRQLLHWQFLELKSF